MSGWVTDRISSDNINSPANFVRLFRPPFQRWRPTRSGARRVGESPFLLLAFLCGSFRQRKAAKDLWYQDLIDAFSFEEKGPKEKALQKEKGRIAQAAGLPLLKKRGKTIAQSLRGEFILSLEILSRTQPDTKCHSGANRHEILSLRSRMTNVAI